MNSGINSNQSGRERLSLLANSNRDITKKNRRVFNTSAIVEFTEDIDWCVMLSQALELSAKIPNTTNDSRQCFMAHPLIMYMLNTDYFNTTSRKFMELFPLDTMDGNYGQISYPMCDMVQEIHMAHTALQHAFSLDITDSSKVVQYNTLCGANFEAASHFLNDSTLLRQQKQQNGESTVSHLFQIGTLTTEELLELREKDRRCRYLYQFGSLVPEDEDPTTSGKNDDPSSPKKDDDPNGPLPTIRSDDGGYKGDLFVGLRRTKLKRGIMYSATNTPVKTTKPTIWNADETQFTNG
jgi:hypothetical protein